MDADHVTPGQLISSLLEERGWTKRVLGAVVGVDESTIGKLISAKRSVDAELALTLEDVFGVKAERFLELQVSYDLARARISHRSDPTLAQRASLFATLPITEMISRGWIDAKDVKDVQAVEQGIHKFFGGVLSTTPHAAKRSSEDVTPIQQAWIRRVQKIGKEMFVPTFSASALRERLAELEALLEFPEETRKVPRILMECGVRFIIVEALTSSKIDGVCLWQDQTPVVALSFRFDRIDNFWFVLRHELAHVLNGDGREEPMLDVEMESSAKATRSAAELAADGDAAEFCVPQKKLRSFIERKDPFFTEQDLLAFAKINRRHPGLVAGQLQRATQRYDRFRKHQIKIRQYVAPSAVVDGWGDVAPVEH